MNSKSSNNESNSNMKSFTKVTGTDPNFASKQKAMSERKPIEETVPEVQKSEKKLFTATKSELKSNHKFKERMANSREASAEKFRESNEMFPSSFKGVKSTKKQVTVPEVDEQSEKKNQETENKDNKENVNNFNVLASKGNGKEMKEIMEMRDAKESCSKMAVKNETGSNSKVDGAEGNDTSCNVDVSVEENCA